MIISGIIQPAFIAAFALFLCACTGRNAEVFSAGEQANLTADDALRSLEDGNARFLAGSAGADNLKRLEVAARGQFPKAVILSCMDSRVPVESIFDCGTGDLFVLRLAGNVVNPDISGSLEYACRVSGAKLIVVLAHEDCGAVKSAVKDVQLGNITQLLEKIKPAAESVKADFSDTSYKNHAYVDAIAKENAKRALAGIREGSPILGAMEKRGEIKLVAAYYDLHSGKVTFFGVPCCNRP